MNDSPPSIVDDKSSENGPRWFALILNLLDVDVSTPIEVIPHHWIRRPTSAEIARIKSGLVAALGEARATIGAGLFEFNLDFGESGMTGSRSTNPDDWRYWVISVAATNPGADNEGFHRLEEASRLSPVELNLHLQFPTRGGVCMSGHAPSDDFSWPRKPQKLDQSILDSIRDIDGSIQNLGTSHPQVRRAINMYRGIGAHSRSDVLYVLGVFAVIESLLTHDPTGEYDSLGHQIRTKMRLLDRRFQPTLDTSAFGTIDFGKLWAKLYGFRSCIAHGRQPDFKQQLKLLKSSEIAVNFLDQAAKKLLRVALQDPDLLVDLQAC